MRFETGLVVGKFSPLHKGHQLLIEHALAACRRLVLISYAKPERSGCERDRRKFWLEALYPQATCLIVDDAWLEERARQGKSNRFSEVPWDEDDELLHRQFTAWLCHSVLEVLCDVVFTSEDYGDGLAATLQDEFSGFSGKQMVVRHICVDKARTIVPVSASAICRDASLRPEYLHEIVRCSLVQRIVFLGGESTGKSTLTRALGEALAEPTAEEYGRELWTEQKGALVESDMLKIAEQQVAREEVARLRASRFVFCDTSPLTTLFYAQHMFGRVDSRLADLVALKYDKVFLCWPDFPLVQDGTRQDEQFRLLQHEWHLKELSMRGISFISLVGSFDQRVAKVREELRL